MPARVCEVHTAVGLTVGDPVAGADVGDTVDAVGATVGDIVEAVVGADVGDTVGAVGATVGDTVGTVSAGVGATVGERVGAKVSWAIVPPASSTKQAAGASIVHSVGIVCKVRRGGAKGES